MLYNELMGRLHTLEYTTEEFLRIAKDCGLSSRQIHRLRQNGIFPRPSRRKGLGRGRGVTWLYSDAEVDQLKKLLELRARLPNRRGTGFIEELRWQLWLEGGWDWLWPRIRDELVALIPEQPRTGTVEELRELDDALAELVVEAFPKAPFPHMRITDEESIEHVLIPALWALANVWGLVGVYEPYVDAEQDERAARAVFGQGYDVVRNLPPRAELLSLLQRADEGVAAKMRPFLLFVDGLLRTDELSKSITDWISKLQRKFATPVTIKRKRKTNPFAEHRMVPVMLRRVSVLIALGILLNNRQLDA
jgi:hypothetical protein